MAHYVVYRADGNRWVVASDVGAPPIGDWIPPRSPQEAIDLFKRLLASRGETVTTVSPSGDIFRIETGSGREPAPYDLTLKLSAMPEVARLLEGLSADLHKSSAETIVQALVMLKIIVDAGNAGKRVVITDDDLNIEREILIPGRRHDDA